MSCFLASSPVGVLLGYVLTTQLIINYTWKYAFYAQAASVVPALLLILLIPNRYFALRDPNEAPRLENEAADAMSERSLDVGSNHGSS